MSLNFFLKIVENILFFVNAIRKDISFHYIFDDNSSQRSFLKGISAFVF